MSEETNKNLIPLNKRTKEEQRAIQSKGGVASGEARKEKKLLKEMLQMVLDKKPQLDSKLKAQIMGLGFDEDELTNRVVSIAAMLDQSSKGNMRATEKIFEITGEHIAKQIITNEAEIEKADNMLVKIKEIANDTD